jgi:large subunit ribosomal protein L21
VSVIEDVVAEINGQIQGGRTGRLFAVVSLNGKQFKVTAEDIIILQGYWAPNVGDRLRLHKVCPLQF